MLPPWKGNFKLYSSYGLYDNNIGYIILTFCDLHCAPLAPVALWLVKFTPQPPDQSPEATL